MNATNETKPSELASDSASSRAAQCSAAGLQMKYFVLKPRGDDIYATASRRAMREYAKTIERENPAFAKDLNEWADDAWANTKAALEAGSALYEAEHRR